MLVRTCTTRVACFCLASPMICTLLVLRKVWYGLDFRQDAGKIQEGNGFCYASINPQQVAFGQGVVVTRGYRSCPAMQPGATVTTALTHQLPLFGALISVAFARTME